MHKLFQPDPARIEPRTHPPTHDRAPDEIAQGSPAWLRDDMVEMLGKDQVHARALDLIRFATDASPYRMFPKIVVTPRTEAEVQKILAYAREKKQTVTIRSAGSSLSGQAQGDGILLDARKHWAGWKVEKGGARLRVRPGTVMFRANLALAPYGYRLGPDPASSGVATIGGVVANNASGMCCGTAENSYKTIESMTFILPSGTKINTADPDAEQKFADAEPVLAKGLLDIRGEILADPP
jgi:D-lactate dehydrogenase